MLLAPESDLRVSLVQADTVWRDAAANRSLYGGLVRPLAGVAARATIVLDENNKVLHSQLVAEIKNEPDYDAALKALG